MTIKHKNQMHLVGNLGDDPKFKTDKSGTASVSFTVCVVEPRKGGNRDKVSWFNVTSRDEAVLAEARALSRYDTIEIWGRIDLNRVTVQHQLTYQIGLEADRVRSMVQQFDTRASNHPNGRFMHMGYDHGLAVGSLSQMPQDLTGYKIGDSLTITGPGNQPHYWTMFNSDPVGNAGNRYEVPIECLMSAHADGVLTPPAG